MELLHSDYGKSALIEFWVFIAAHRPITRQPQTQTMATTKILNFPQMSREHSKAQEVSVFLTVFLQTLRYARWNRKDPMPCKRRALNLRRISLSINDGKSHSRRIEAPQSSALWKRRMETVSSATPSPAIAAICGQRISIPTPFRYVPDRKSTRL